MKQSLRTFGPLFLVGAIALLLAAPVHAQTPTVFTDKDDYAPGETVQIGGAGWLPGETVMMWLLEDPVIHDVVMLLAVADSSGAFVNKEFAPEVHDLGTTFTLVATGQVSGWTAQTVFTDGPKVGSTSVGAQSPAQLCPGASATYTITVNRGTGPGSSGSFTAALSVTTALPAGVSASFSPGALSFTPSQSSRTATLTLSSSSSTTAGTSAFTVRAGTSAFDFAVGGGSLTVDTTPPLVAAPPTATLAVGAGCQAAIPDLRSTVTASDNCTATVALVITQSPAPGTLVGLGGTAVTLTVTDLLGNNASAITNVTVVDQTPPVVALLGANPVTLEGGTPFVDPGATATDGCAGGLPVTVAGSVNVIEPGSYALTYTANDGNGNSASVTRTVNVVDTTPPALTLAGAVPLTVECHTSFSDPGASAVDICDGDVSGAIQVSGTVDANTVGSYTLTYSATDDHGNTASASRTVNVVDTTPPAVSLAGAASMTVECHSSFSDPGAAATDLCAGDLSGAVQVSGTVDANTVGSYTLTYSVDDGHGNVASASRTVDVVDTTPPAVSLAGAASMTVECHSSFSDPGATATDLCAGDLSGAVQVSGTVDANAVGSYTLTYSVDDGHGNVASASRTVDVVDTTPPALTVPSAIAVSTGASATVCGVSVSDAALGAANAMDVCAGVLEVHRTGVPEGGLFPVGTTLIIYSVSDPSGNVTTGIQAVTVTDDAPPTIASIADIVQVVDVGQCTAVVRFELNVTDNCPGATYVATPASGAAFAVGTTTPVQVTATDAAGNSSICSFNVTVTNPAPVVTITGPPSGAVYAVNTPVSFTGTFTDNAGDTHTAQWQLDGQSLAGAVNEATGAVSLTHQFTTPGVYAVTLSVTDQCGGVGTASDLTGLSAMVVIYDPNGGFVTGGGWIQSPAGAYRPDVSLVGKANFGFVSKYKKGQSTPTGETEFQFKAGNLNFHSSGYEWLVVAGARAQFKGWGTVNGAGDYVFLLSAVDGQGSSGDGTDKFRAKIWLRSSGQVVYDNQFGSEDSSAASTALGGGSIVIHSASGSNKASLAATDGTDALGSPPGFTFALAPAAPNPFRNVTTLRFSVAERSRVSVAIYDAAGREVARPMEEEIAAGPHSVTWSGRSASGTQLGSGVYFLRLTATPMSGGASSMKRQSIVLVR